MEEKILFIFFNDEIKFLTNPTMDHKEWYISLGGNIEEYDEVIRGFIIRNYIIFFKANLSYDSKVIDIATKYGPIIRKQVNKPNLKICCGINPGRVGEEWEPILQINDEEIVRIEQQKIAEQNKQARQKQIVDSIAPTEAIIEFKNDFSNENFIKKGLTFTLLLLFLAIIAKIIMINNRTFMLSNRWNALLLFAQMISFTLTIVGYKQKLPKVKYFAIAATISSVLMFDILDIIVGVTNLLFTINQTYITNITDFVKSIFRFIINKIKNKHVKK